MQSERNAGLSETIRDVVERFADPPIGGMVFRTHPFNKRYLTFAERIFLETLADVSQSRLARPRSRGFGDGCGVSPPTTFPPPSAKERRRHNVDLLRTSRFPFDSKRIIASRRGEIRTSSSRRIQHTEEGIRPMDEEVEKNQMDWKFGELIEKPSFLPADYKPGDPLPRLDIRDHPSWESYRKTYFTPETERRLLKFYADAGPNATNQLARASEYYAVARRVRDKFEELFRDQGRNSFASAGGRKLNWFQCTHSEIELRYDKDPKTASFDLVFYVSFVGEGYPPFEDWQDAAKTELGQASFEPVETFFYVPREHGPSSDRRNPYHPETTLASDSDVMSQYGSSFEGAFARSKKKTPWCVREGLFLWDDLSNSEFDDLRYFGSFRAFSHNPNFSDPRRLQVGNPEMIIREEKEKLSDILEKQKVLPKKKKNSQSKGPNVRPLDVSERSSGIETFNVSSEDFEKLNETHPDRVAELPTLSNVGVIAPFGTKKIYLNGTVFRALFEKDLSSAFVSKTGKAVGFNTLKDRISSYRLTFRVGGLPFHFVDRRLDPPKLSARNEFDEFYFSFQTAWKKHKETYGGEPRHENDLREVLLPPLVDARDLEWAEKVGISLPEHPGRLSTRELVDLIDAKDKGTQFDRQRPPSSNKGKKANTTLRAKVNTLVGKSEGAGLDNFFQKKQEER